ncbi:MAG TPA: serine hydrolase domain-containing protein [Thermoanaerobaculia bacterium]|nr:serine hydrolase domain-containing protein [Thermoanaerobaculia bacterium]
MTDAAGFLDSEIARGSFPGAVALMGTSEEVMDLALAGSAAVEPEPVPVSEGTLWDLASLTKPLCCGALVRVAAREGLSLDLPPGFFFPAWKRTRYDGITLRTLLTHTSGLAAWYPLYTRGEGADAYRKTLSEMEPQAAPGSSVIYSDLNFLLVGDILEAHFSAPIDAVFSELVARPAGSEARFLPADRRATAATEKGDVTERGMAAALGLSYARFRTDVVWGEVHDGNARRRGGVAGNAGLFGSARDVWALARMWLEDFSEEFCSDRTPTLPEARGLSWQGKRGAGSSVPGMSPRSFGHTGFTGTSLWIDPEAGRIAILLTNRVHPTVKAADFNEVRRRFHGIAWSEGH